MIPKQTQSRPNVWPQHICPKCNYRLEDGALSVGEKKLRKWNFCPICGQEIEWDKVEPVKWQPLDCKLCGKKLVYDGAFGPMATAEYIDGDICRECRMEHCRTTNCHGCNDGKYPDCKYLYLKRLAVLKEAPDGED